MLWKNQVFMKMFAAYGLATLGTWFDFIAVSVLLAYVWHVDPMTMAFLVLAYFGPGIFLGQIAGILADRWNKLTIMIVADIFRAVLTVLLIFSPSPLWALIVISFRSAADCFHTPAQQAMTRYVVPENLLYKATALNGTVMQLGKVLGPLFGGAVVAVASPAFCMGINVVCFVLSSILLLTIRTYRETGADTRQTDKKVGMWEAWRDGWAIIFQRRILLASLIFSMMAGIAIQLVDAQFAVFMREKAPGHPELLGWTTASIGFGALITVAWMNRYNELTSYGWILGGGTFLIGVLFLWFGLYEKGQPIVFVLISAFIGGIGTGLTSVGSNYLRQKESPVEAVGRVMGIFNSLQSAVFIIAPLVGGMMVTALGISYVCQAVGFVLGAIGITGILLRKQLWSHAAGSARGMAGQNSSQLEA